MEKGNSRGKRLLAWLLAAAMIVTPLVPSSPTAQAAKISRTEDSEEEPSGEKEAWTDIGEFIYTADLDTSAPSAVRPFGLDDGIVDLKSGNYERWIDRIDLPEEEFRLLYDRLAEGSDGDGTDDFLIEDAAFEPDKNGKMTVTVPVITVEFPLERKEDAAKESKEVFDRYTPYVSAVYSAFDRDYPEVFWMGNAWNYGYSGEYSGSEAEGYTGRIHISLFLSRTEKYPDEAAIRAAIEKRDSDIAEIMAGKTGDSDYETICYFNDTLTKRNQYNTAVSGGAVTADPDCWECVSALAGQAGENGPVCEGYARAFQVLCKKAGIACTLVDGNAQSGTGSGPHMWNYVKLDGEWYGADVTWNDPVGNPAGGAVSGLENREWLLVGEEKTDGSGRDFLTTHPVENRISSNGVAFLNGPVLSKTNYVPKKVVSLTGVASYAGETLQDTFTYGDTITVKASVSYPEGNSGVSNRTGEPGARQMALYLGDRQISDPVSEENGIYTMSYSTRERLVPVGRQILTARFIGDGEVGSSSKDVAITLNPLEPVLTVPSDLVLPYTGEAAEIPASSVELPGMDEAPDYSYSYCKEGGSAYTDEVPVSPGKYSVKVSVAADAAGFYKGAEKTFSLEIRKTSVSLRFLASYAPGKVYDGTALALPTEDQMEIGGALYGDVVFTWYRKTVAEENKITDPTQAGDYILVASVADTESSEGVQAQISVSVTRRPVNIQIAEQGKVYGAEEPEIGYTVDAGTPLVAGESLTGRLTRAPGEDVGSYAIGPGTLDEANNPNYRFTYGTGSFTIRPAGYRTEVEPVQTILAGTGEFKKPDFIGVNNEKVSGVLTYKYKGVDYAAYADLVKQLQSLEVGASGSIEAVFVPDADGNYTGISEVRIAFTISDITFFVGGHPASDANAVTKKENPVYGDTWEDIVRISDQLTAKVGSASDSERGHFTLSVTGNPKAGAGQAYQVLYHGTLNGNEYSGVVVCSGTVDVAQALLGWDTAGLSARDRQSKIVDGRATLTGALQVSGILPEDKQSVSFVCPAERLTGTYANVAPGSQKVVLGWAADAPAVLQGEGAENYRLPDRLPEITGQIHASRREPVPGLSEDRYQLEIEDGLSEVPAALQGKPELNTAEKIENRMRINVRTKTPSVPDKDIAIYDVRLLFSSDGQSWVEATAENFPSEGILVTLPYPSGTTKDTHDFTVAHMFTVTRNNYQPGDVEYPAVKKTDAGIQFRVYSLSPIAVGWISINQAPSGTTAAPQPSTSAQTTNSASTAPSQPSTQNPSSVTGTQTGDNNYVIYLYLLLLLVAGMAVCLLVEKRRAERR
ncbi:MAG: hypothetical protein HFI93_10675 [Lachnospiraceae bacterium]|nr:hypothetical protein [Lachnospiraceae bacterium]